MNHIYLILLILEKIIVKEKSLHFKYGRYISKYISKWNKSS